jgi:hypothetical protein
MTVHGFLYKDKLCGIDPDVIKGLEGMGFSIPLKK